MPLSPFFLSFLLVLAVACSGGDESDSDVSPGPDAAAWDACEDGCFEGGACVPGTSATACGADGLACIVCAADEQCHAGACVPACGPETCDGCCSGDTCLTGDSAAACGAGGGACLDCGARGICEQDRCEIDPESRWDVVALRADVPTTNAEGNSWDPLGGLPDPFARMLDADDRQLDRTGTDGNTETPVWGEVIAADVRAGDLPSFAFEVLDDDGGGDDSFGSCSFGTLLRFEDFGDVNQSLSCGGPTPYTLWLRYEPR